MSISNIRFEKRAKGFLRQKIEEIPSGKLFIAGYHDPNDVMKGVEHAVSVYVKLPKSARCLMEEALSNPPTESEVEAINKRRIAFNLTRGCTKAFDPGQYGYLVDADMQIYFMMEGWAVMEIKDGHLTKEEDNAIAQAISEGKTIAITSKSGDEVRIGGNDQGMIEDLIDDCICRDNYRDGKIEIEG